MNEHLHIGIENSSSSRKELLNFNIDIIKALARIENLKKIRHKKNVQLNKLRVLTKRLEKSVAEFKGELPHTKLPSLIAKEKQKPNLAKNKTTLNQNLASKNKQANKEPVNTNTSRLEEELKKLKEKIDKL